MTDPADKPNEPLRTGRRQYAGRVLAWFAPPNQRKRVREWLRENWPAVLRRPECLLKTNRGTRVARAGVFVLKEFRKPRGLAGLFRPSRARQAFAAAHALAAAGLPVHIPAAWALRRRHGFLVREYLLTENIADALPLDVFLRLPGRTDAERAAVLDQWGALLAGFHRAGFTNRDLKDENLLVTRAPAGLTLHAVDMDGVSRPWRVTRRLARRDFWPLQRSLLFHGLFDAANLARLLDAYNAGSPPVRLRETDLLPVWTDRAPAAAGWRSAAVLVAVSGLIRKTLRVHVPAAADPRDRAVFPYWMGRLPGLRPVRHTTRSQVSEGPWPATGAPCFFKRYPPPTLAGTIRNLFRAPRAVRAWRNRLALQAAGFRTPRVLALLDARTLGRPAGGAVITEAVPGAEPLADYLSRAGAGLGRRAALRAAGAELGHLHKAGFSLPRLNPRGILVQPAGDTIAVWWADPDDLVSGPSLRARARELARLRRETPALAPADLRTAWRAYRAAAGLTRAAARRVLLAGSAATPRAAQTKTNKTGDTKR